MQTILVTWEHTYSISLFAQKTQVDEHRRKIHTYVTRLKRVSAHAQLLSEITFHYGFFSNEKLDKFGGSPSTLFFCSQLHIMIVSGTKILSRQKLSISKFFGKIRRKKIC
uniref:Uncharacterized protein n=1 Tax=Cacopsylla melanoneura TaxID=428564 RepID=A0A8D8WJS5_9HEMI